MSRLFSALFSALLVVGATIAVAAPQAHAAPVIPFDASVFPQGAQYSLEYPYANAQIDCDWYLSCTLGRGALATPLAHTRTGEQLGRIGGWGLFATYLTSEDQTHHVSWDFYVSFFKPGLNSRGKYRSAAAAKDFQRAISDPNLANFQTTKPGLSLNTPVLNQWDGGLVNGTDKITAITFATPDFEVEGLMYYDVSRKSDARAGTAAFEALATALAHSTAAGLQP